MVSRASGHIPIRPVSQDLAEFFFVIVAVKRDSPSPFTTCYDGRYGGPLPQSVEVLIGLPDSDHVLLRNWRHAPEDWTYSDAEIRCGPWQGGIKVAFYADELARFAEAIRTLYSDLHGKAELKPFDCRFALVLTGNGRGEIIVDGHAGSDFVTDTELRFQFLIDQTFLLRIADGFAAVKSR